MRLTEKLKFTDSSGERTAFGYYACAGIGFFLFLAASVYLTIAVFSMKERPPLLLLFGTPINTILGFCVIQLPALIGIINLIYGIKLTRKRLKNGSYAEEKGVQV